MMLFLRVAKITYRQTEPDHHQLPLPFCTEVRGLALGAIEYAALTF